VNQKAIVAAFVLVLLNCAPTAPQSSAPTDSRWIVRNIGSLRSTNVDEPDCHPLAFFSENPRTAEHLRDFAGPASNAINDEVQVLPIGEINGFAIYSIIDDIEYPASVEMNPMYIKLIAVERKPGEFCKIYEDFDDRTIMATVSQAHIEDFGQEKLLASKDRVSGTGGGMKEMYWVFDDEGPILLYFSAADDALQKVLPRQFSFGTTQLDLNELAFSRGFDFATLTFESPVFCPACTCDVDGAAYRFSYKPGTVNVQFGLKNHQLQIVGQNYVQPTMFVGVDPDTQATKLIERVEPDYPPELREAGVQGTIVVGVVIGPDGRVTDAGGSSGRTALMPAAAETVRKWRYTPTLVGDTSVEVRTTVEVKFPPDDGACPSSSPPVERPNRICVASEIEAAKLIDQIQPVYPVEARQDGIMGNVVLHVIIGKDGTVSDAKLFSGHPLLLEAARDAVRQWRYMPTLLNGQPVEVETTVTVPFVFDYKLSVACRGGSQKQQ